MNYCRGTPISGNLHVFLCYSKWFPLWRTPSGHQYASRCVCVCACVCVCVDHLHRCKASFCLVLCFCCWFNKIFLPCMQGVVAGSRVYHQRRHSGFPGDTWPDQPCVPAFPIFVNGDRLSQVPACRSNPFQFLHCCRNLVFFWVLLHQNLLQSKNVESIPRTEFHDGSTNFSCQTVLDCLCTFDAFHISNR